MEFPRVFQLYVFFWRFVSFELNSEYDVEQDSYYEDYNIPKMIFRPVPTQQLDLDIETVAPSGPSAPSLRLAPYALEPGFRYPE